MPIVVGSTLSAILYVEDVVDRRFGFAVGGLVAQLGDQLGEASWRIQASANRCATEGQFGKDVPQPVSTFLDAGGKPHTFAEFKGKLRGKFVLATGYGGAVHRLAVLEHADRIVAVGAGAPPMSMGAMNTATRSTRSGGTWSWRASSFRGWR